MSTEAPRAATRPGVLRRVATGLAALALPAAGLAVPTFLPDPQPQFQEIDTVAVGPGPVTLVCPAAPALASATGAADVSFDLEFDPGVATMTGTTQLISATPVAAEAVAGEAGRTPTPVTSVAELSAGNVPIIAHYPPVGQEAPVVGGMTIASAQEGDLRGLIAGACLRPSSSTWLVGGDTEVGSTTQLVLTNPGDSPARVNVRTWTGTGEGGEITRLLEPQGAAVVLTETVQRTERLAFHVTSEGGQVAAYLVTSTLAGIVPGGVSIVSPGAPPAQDTYVGPVRLEDYGVGAWRTDVRIVNPAPEVADVEITLLGPDGEEALPGAQSLQVDPGTVTDIPIAGPRVGQYVVKISATVPVAASVRTVAEGEYDDEVADTPHDLAWLPSGQPAPSSVLPTGAGATLTLANPEPDPITVAVERITDEGTPGGQEDLTIAGLSTSRVPTSPDLYAIRLTGAVHLATAQYEQDAGGPLIAGLPAMSTAAGGAVVGVIADN